MIRRVMAAALLIAAGGGAGWLAVWLRCPSVCGEPGVSTAQTPSGARQGGATSPQLIGRGLGRDGDAAAITDLQQRVSRLEAVLSSRVGFSDLNPQLQGARVLNQLKAIKHGERQASMAAVIRDLVSLGDQVVPDLVSLLEEGLDTDWGGRVSVEGHAVKSYGRRRTLIIDALRQIGTQTAQGGLVAALRQSDDLRDYRDLLLLYRSTTDVQMREQIAELIPRILELVDKVGIGPAEEKAALIATLLVDWIREGQMRELSDAVARLVRTSLLEEYKATNLLGLLVEFDPRAAFVLVQQLWGKGLQDAAGNRLLGFTVRGEVPLAQVAHYMELLFSDLNLAERQRTGLYLSLRPRPCQRIEDPVKRAEDASVLMEFLKGRLEVEERECTRRLVEQAIDGLREEIGGTATR